MSFSFFNHRAVAELFKSAGYQKRSYIRSFIKVISALGPVLLYKPEIPRALGLSLAQRLDEVEDLPSAIAGALDGWENRSVRDELALLRRFASDQTGDDLTGGATRAAPKSRGGKAKTSFQFDRAEGRARCTAAAGRLEIRLDRDFSTVDRRKLEAAVKALLDTLD